MRREVDQVAAVEEGNDLHSRREEMVVEVIHFLVERGQHRVPVCPFAQQNDSLHRIGLIDNRAILPVSRLSDLSQPDLWPLRYERDLTDVDGRTVLRFENRLPDISYVAE